MAWKRGRTREEDTTTFNVSFEISRATLRMLEEAARRARTPDRTRIRTTARGLMGIMLKNEFERALGYARVSLAEIREKKKAP